jgi:hypothetical protein
MIDLHDCDARLPSSGNPNDVYMDELLRLSILLGSVLKTIYALVFFYFLIVGENVDLDTPQAVRFIIRE